MSKTADFKNDLAVEILARFTGNSRGTPIARSGFIDGANWAHEKANLESDRRLEEYQTKLKERASRLSQTLRKADPKMFPTLIIRAEAIEDFVKELTEIKKLNP